MSVAWNEQSWNDTLEQVLDRAAEDAEFRTLCLTDAHAAVREVSGNSLPADMKLSFSTESAEMVIQLPPLRESGELADEELEAVAGGLCISTSSFCIKVSSNCSGFCIAHTGFCF